MYFNQTPNNGIQCAINVVFIHEFSKNLPTVGGGGETPLPHHRFGPPLTNPGCTTVTGIAKRHKGPCFPLIGVKYLKGEYNRGLVYATSHNYTP